MSHSLSLPASRAAAKKKLIHALADSAVVAGILPLWNKAFSDFKAEIRKSKLSWLRDEDVDSILYTTYFKLPDELRQDGPVGVVLGDKVEKFADDVIGYISSPNGYWIHFPLPQIEITENFNLSEDMILEPRYESTLGLLDLALQGENSENQAGYKISGAILKVRASGYVHSMRSQSAFVDALTKVKWALQVATLKGYLLRVPRPPSKWAVVLGGAGQSEIYQVHCIADRPMPDEVTSVTLGIGLSKYLSELKFTTGDWNKSKKPHLTEDVGRVVRAFTDPKAEANVKSIRRSLEWAFDAAVDDDEHMSFIKTCIGLEAAISEQNEDVGIIEQLADRCAFLLTKTYVAREETRIAIRKIYKLRSKFVHGAVLGLSDFDRESAVYAQMILRAVLATELQAFMDWYKPSQPN
jgi:hypothetical protein